MRTAGKFALVLVTAPDLKTARKLAKAALLARLIACANLVPKVESHYRWGGKIESASEILLILKTTRSRVTALENLILEKHPYDTPEFLVLPLGDGTRRYLKWLSDCTARGVAGR
jgi:periplasmic divalent cation tolerance protein